MQTDIELTARFVKDVGNMIKEIFVELNKKPKFKNNFNLEGNEIRSKDYDKRIYLFADTLLPEIRAKTIRFQMTGLGKKDFFTQVTVDKNGTGYSRKELDNAKSFILFKICELLKL